MPAVVDLERVLVRVVKIDKIYTHPKADRLDLAMVGGWQIVVKRDEYKPGDLAIYAEIDSLLPISEPTFASLANINDIIREYDKVKYARIKSIRLRGEMSQGILVKIPEEQLSQYKEGQNLTEQLKVMKYVSDADMIQYQAVEHGEARGIFKRIAQWIEGEPRPVMQMGWPSFLKKSDQERVQNMATAVALAHESGEQFEKTVKLDGSSMTIFFKREPEGDRVGVCSRSHELRTSTIKYTKIQALRYWLADLVSRIPRMVRKFEWLIPTYHRELNVGSDMYVGFWYQSDISTNLKTYCTNNDVSLVLQGELCGPGIQGNYEELDRRMYFVYNIFEIVNGTCRLMPPDQARELFEKELQCYDSKYIPVLEKSTTLPPDMKKLIASADGPLYFSNTQGSKKRREGVVYKSLIRPLSFKIISNKRLLEEK